MAPSFRSQSPSSTATGTKNRREHTSRESKAVVPNNLHAVARSLQQSLRTQPYEDCQENLFLLYRSRGEDLETFTDPPGCYQGSRDNTLSCTLSPLPRNLQQTQQKLAIADNVISRSLPRLNSFGFDFRIIEARVSWVMGSCSSELQQHGTIKASVTRDTAAKIR